jgi:hypothetical protein
MNSLERAKRFLARKASRLALAVVPLAAVAISSSPAKANAVLTSDDCSVTVGSGSCGIELSGTPGGNNHLNSAFLSTSGSTVLSVGGVVDFSGGSPSGGASGSYNGKVPVAWDFDIVTTTATNRVVAYTITFTLNGSGGAVVASFTTSGSATSSSGGTAVSGTANIPTPGASTPIFGYTITLDTDNGNGKAYGIEIPADSTLDLNPLTSTPEPSTLLLTIPGVGALLLLRRKKRS